MVSKLGGRPARIDREQILKVALELGVDNLSMHAVARRLKVSTTALYRYVKSKDELLDACMDLFCERIQMPDPSLPWDQYLFGTGQAFRQALLATPGASSYGVKIGPTTPAAFAILEGALEVLVRDGFEILEAWLAYSLVVDHAFTNVAKMEQMAMLEPENGPGGYRVLQLGEGDGDRFPHLVNAISLWATGAVEVETLYERQLDAIVAGIGARYRTLSSG